MARNAHGIIHAQATHGIGRGDLTHGLPHYRGGLGTQTAQQIRQRDLDTGDAHLRAFQVKVLLIIEDLIHDGPTGFPLHNLIQLLQALREERGLLVEILAHLAVLRAKPGVHPGRTHRGRGIRGLGSTGVLALGDALQAIDGLLNVAGQRHGAGAAVIATSQRTRHFIKSHRLGTCALFLQPCHQIRCGSLAPAWQQPTDGQQIRGIYIRSCIQPNGRLIFAALSSSAGILCLGGFQHHVRIGSTEAEPGHASHWAARVLRPFPAILHHFQAVAIKIDIWVWPGEVQ